MHILMAWILFWYVIFCLKLFLLAFCLFWIYFFLCHSLLASRWKTLNCLTTCHRVCQAYQRRYAALECNLLTSLVGEGGLAMSPNLCLKSGFFTSSFNNILACQFRCCCHCYSFCVETLSWFGVCEFCKKKSADSENLTIMIFVPLLSVCNY